MDYKFRFNCLMETFSVDDCKSGEPVANHHQIPAIQILRINKSSIEEIQFNFFCWNNGSSFELVLIAFAMSLIINASDFSFSLFAEEIFH